MMTDISILNNILLVILVLVLLLSFYVLKANRKNPLNISFSLFSLFIALWVFLNYLWGFYQTSHTLLILTYISSLFIGSSMVIWLNFLFRKFLPKWLIYFAIITTTVNIALAIISFLPSNLLIKDVQNRLEFTTGPLFALFSGYFLIIILIFLIFLFVEYKRSSSELKRSINIIAGGVFLSLAIATLVSYVLPTLGYVNFAIFDAPSSIFFVAFSAYTILRMQLFNIRVFFTEIITYFVLIVTFIFMFVFLKNINLTTRIIFMFLFAYGGYFLLKSVQKEVEQKEELQQLTQQLQTANTKLKQVDAMKTEFISLASHELLTPISAIEGYLSMMLDEKIVKIDNEKAVEYMSRVYTSAKRLARLVADLLNVSRIEQGRMLVDKKEIDLHALVNEVVKELKFKAQEKKHKILTSVRENINTKTYGDVDKVKEIIINLTGNSIKYTKDGGLIGIGIDQWPTSKVESNFNKMQSELKEHGKTSEGSLQNIVNDKFAKLIGDKQLVVIIKDTGIGISHDDLGRLFQKFSRVGDWSTQEVQGTGLGLYISRALVEMHHGRIWAYSEGEGKGSTFYFSLPTVKAENQIKQLDSEIPVAKDAKPLAKSAS